MDTAQRGMGLDWPTSLELIQRAVKAGKAWEARNGRPALIASGCGTDHLDPAQRALDRRGDPRLRGADGGHREGRRPPDRHGEPRARPRRQVARRLRARLRPRAVARRKEPVIIHWLGEMFDPALAGYWGIADHMAAMQTAVGIINAHAAKVDGVKISLLDKDKEIVMRRQLAKGVRMYTGDDFNYAELIAGDEQGLQRRPARHLRRHRAGRLRRAGGAGRRRPRTLRRHPGAHRAAVAPHLPGADALLQDRRGVHGLSQRPAGPLRHGRRPAERALARRTWPSCSASPTAPACCAIPDAGPPAAWSTCWPCTGSR